MAWDGAASEAFIRRGTDLESLNSGNSKSLRAAPDLYARIDVHVCHTRHRAVEKEEEEEEEEE